MCCSVHLPIPNGVVCPGGPASSPVRWVAAKSPIYRQRTTLGLGLLVFIGSLWPAGETRGRQAPKLPLISRDTNRSEAKLQWHAADISDSGRRASRGRSPALRAWLRSQSPPAAGLAPDQPPGFPEDILNPQISVIICTYNRVDRLAAALASLTRQTLDPAAFEVLVVDNNSIDTTADLVQRMRAQPFKLRYLLESHQGLSLARNRGCHEARAGILAFLDDDAIAAPGWLACLWEDFTRRSVRPTCVGGRVEGLWERPRPSWCHDGLLGYYSLLDLPMQAPAVLPHEYVFGCNMAFDRAALAAIGGFPVVLGRVGSSLISGEETLVQDALRDRGGQILYDPRAAVQHLVEARRLSKAWMLRRLYCQGVTEVLIQRLRGSDGHGRSLKRTYWQWRILLRHPQRLWWAVCPAGRSDAVFHRKCAAWHCLGALTGAWQRLPPALVPCRGSMGEGVAGSAATAGE